MSYFDNLEKLLEEYDWKPNNQKKTPKIRKGEYSLSVGLTCHWMKPGKPTLPTIRMRKDPRIYNECKKLFPDFDFEMVIINKNFLCAPHKDINNTTESLIVGLGDYDGGDLCIEDHKTGQVSKHCIWRSPLYFNGKDNRHWTDDFTGTRYTVVLGNAKFIAHRDGDEKQKMNSQICADGCG